MIEKVSQAANKEYVIKPVVNCKQLELNPPGKSRHQGRTHTSELSHWKEEGMEYL